jgi:uncharacterized membrane protein YccC
MNDTPTPRTDALMADQVHKRTIYDHIQVMETHARKLERELADMTKQRDALAAACSAIEHAYLEGSDSEWGNALMDIRQALAATKGGKP